MGLGQMILEVMEEEESHPEKHIVSNDVELWHRGTYGFQGENDVEPHLNDEVLTIFR